MPVSTKRRRYNHAKWRLPLGNSHAKRHLSLANSRARRHLPLANSHVRRCLLLWNSHTRRCLPLANSHTKWRLPFANSRAKGRLRLANSRVRKLRDTRLQHDLRRRPRRKRPVKRTRRRQMTALSPRLLESRPASRQQRAGALGLG